LESEVTPPLNKQNKLLCVPPDSLERVWFLLLRVHVISFVSSYWFCMLLLFTCTFSVESTKMMPGAEWYGINFDLLL
jgi:hypothetical protein